MKELTAYFRKPMNTYTDSHSSRFCRLAYGKARSMNPRKTAPQPEPRAQAVKTKLETSPAGRL